MSAQTALGALTNGSQLINVHKCVAGTLIYGNGKHEMPDKSINNIIDEAIARERQAINSLYKQILNLTDSEQFLEEITDKLYARTASERLMFMDTDKLDRISNRIDNINARVSDIENRTTKFNKEIYTTNERLASIDKLLQDSNNTVDRIDKLSKQLKNSSNTERPDNDKIIESLQKCNNSVDEINTKLIARITEDAEFRSVCIIMVFSCIFILLFLYVKSLIAREESCY